MSASDATANAEMAVGDLVIVPREPTLGVCRVERFLDVDGVASVRLLMYARAGFVVRATIDTAPCPPNTRVA
jgi:hypothetical protein